MKKFSEILALDGVEGVVLFSSSGELLGWDLSSEMTKIVEEKEWHSILHSDGLKKIARSFEGIAELELFFLEKRILIRKAGDNHLLIVMRHEASSDMIRLVSDSLIPVLRKMRKPGKLAGFFRF